MSGEVKRYCEHGWIREGCCRCSDARLSLPEADEAREGLLALGEALRGLKIEVFRRGAGLDLAWHVSDLLMVTTWLEERIRGLKEVLRG